MGVGVFCCLKDLRDVWGGCGGLGCLGVFVERIVRVCCYVFGVFNFWVFSV